jgi:Zn finger protein HypA/HybF involved in hydrogenase expression
MSLVRCLCGKEYSYHSKVESETLTYACPACQPKKWRIPEISKIHWKTYPEMKRCLAKAEVRNQGES